jgi:AbrB family looped-hinge helix DNA binding protein
MAKKAATAAQEVEYLATTRLGEKGQVTIPKEYRDSLELEAGAPITVVRIGTALLLTGEPSRVNALCERLAGIFSSGSVSESDLLEGIAAIISNQETIIANQGRIIANQKKILAK